MKRVTTRRIEVDGRLFNGDLVATPVITRLTEGLKSQVSPRGDR